MSRRHSLKNIKYVLSSSIYIFMYVCMCVCIYIYACMFVTLEYESSHNNAGIFVAIAKNTLYGSKLSIFLLCQKSLDIKNVS